MSAAFNTPDRGDSAVNEAKTSDAPQFDLKSLYSDLSATTRGGESNKNNSDQLDFGPTDIYSRISNNSSSDKGFNLEQKGAMDIAKRFASFDDQNDKDNDFNFDREDAGRLVEVYGDMFNAQQSLQEGDKSEAKDWLGEMRRDLTAFARGLFSDSDNTEREGQGDQENHDGGRHHNDERDEQSNDNGKEDCPEKHCPAEETEHGSEESGEAGENHIDSGNEGYTPKDSMVLLQNDLQELSQAIASGDEKNVQQILARMSRHMALLMRQLGQSDENVQEQDPENPADATPRTPGLPGRDQEGINPLDPGRLLDGLPNPGDLLPGLPGLPGLPNPGDMLDRLPNPGELLQGMPALPNPSQIFDGLPMPPSPGDLLNGLPKPPSPSDILNPGKLLTSLPKPSDIFDIF